MLTETRRSLYRILAEDETARRRTSRRTSARPVTPVTCRAAASGLHTGRDASRPWQSGAAVGVDRLPPALRRRDYALLWVALARRRARRADGRGRGRLAGLRDPPLAVRPRADRAGRVRAAARARAAGRPSRRPRSRAGASSPPRCGRRSSWSRCCSSSSPLNGATQLWPFLVLAAGVGVATAIAMPPGRALPAIARPARADRERDGAALDRVPDRDGRRARASAACSSRSSPSSSTARPRCCSRSASSASCCIREPRARARRARRPGSTSVLAGIRFIRRTPVLLGRDHARPVRRALRRRDRAAPVFAQTILHTGPVGLGLLRSAPAVGRAGRRASCSPAGRCARTRAGRCSSSSRAFGVEHDRVRAVALVPALAGSRSPSSGFVDMISVNIRATTVAIVDARRAPRARARGRDGLHQRLERARRVRVGRRRRAARRGSGGRARRRRSRSRSPRVWTWVFPTLARIDRLEDLRPAPP